MVSISERYAKHTTRAARLGIVRKQRPGEKTDLKDFATWGKYYSDKMTWDEYVKKGEMAEYGTTKKRKEQQRKDMVVETSYPEPVTTVSAGEPIPEEAKAVYMTPKVASLYRQAERRDDRRMGFEETVRRDQEALASYRIPQSSPLFEMMAQQPTPSGTMNKAQLERALLKEEYERGRQESMMEIQRAYDIGLVKPVMRGIPGKTVQEEYAKEILVGVGGPLVLAAGYPGVREKTLSYITKYPREASSEAIYGSLLWPLYSGYEAVGKYRKKQYGAALGSVATTAVMLGTMGGITKGGLGVARRVRAWEPTTGKTMKGMAGVTRKKKPQSLQLLLTKKMIEIEQEKYNLLLEKGVINNEGRVTDTGKLILEKLKEAKKKNPKLNIEKTLKNIVGVDMNTGRVYVNVQRRAPEMGAVRSYVERTRIRSRSLRVPLLLPLSRQRQNYNVLTRKRKRQIALLDMTMLRSMQGTSMSVAQRQRTAQKAKSAQKQKQKSLIDMSPLYRGGMGRRTGRPRNGRGKRIPLLILPVPIKTQKSRIFGGRGSPKSILPKERYAPSLLAVFGNIRAKKRPRVQTGFGIRPIVDMRYLKRKRK